MYDEKISKDILNKMGKIERTQRGRGEDMRRRGRPKKENAEIE